MLLLLNYYSFYNFSHFILVKQLKVLPYTNLLDISVVNTSILGFILTYLYPKKLIVNTKKKKIVIKKKYLKLIDFIFHQFPLLYICLDNKKKDKDIPHIFLALPVSFWLMFIKYRQIDINKLYGIKMKYLLSLSGCISSFFILPNHLQYFIYNQ